MKTVDELRAAVTTLRRSSVPVADVIPTLQRAADRIEALESALLEAGFSIIEFTNATLRASTKRLIEQHREKAAKWDALRNCARMTTLGSAGIHPLSDTLANPEGHVTLNFWTHTSEGWGLGKEVDTQDAGGRRDLDTFVGKVLALKVEADRRFGQPHYGHGDKDNG